MGLGKLSAAQDMDSKAIEMDSLRLNHADHHPAKGLQVAFVCPPQARLTEEFAQGMMKAGGGWHG